MQTSGAQKPRTFTVHIEGRVVGRPQSHALMLGEDTKSIWIATPTEIPIRNGRFSWAVTDSVERMYKMAFAEEYQQGAYRGILFINEGDTLHATLYSDERAAENVIGGSPQNDSLYVRKHWVDEQFRNVLTTPVSSRSVNSMPMKATTISIVIVENSSYIGAPLLYRA